MKTKPTVFFHGDLDGVVCYLLMCWAAGERLPYVVTTPMKLQGDYEKWQAKHEVKQIYFVDLDVTSIAPQIDSDDTVIFDHHKTNIFKFQKAKTKIYTETSCAKLIYDCFFREKNVLSQAQKILVALADDWDSGKHKNSLSEELNIVFHSTNNKYESFVEDYYNGFKPFDKFKTNTVSLYRKHCSEYLESLTPFIGEVDFEGAETKVGAVFCDKFVQECCDFLFKKHNVGVAIAVLLDKKRIAVRRHPDNLTTDVSKFVQRIASGGGHEGAAGGMLTDEFAEFAKLLKPVQ